MERKFNLFSHISRMSENSRLWHHGWNIPKKETSKRVAWHYPGLVWAVCAWPQHVGTKPVGLATDDSTCMWLQRALSPWIAIRRRYFASLAYQRQWLKIVNLIVMRLQKSKSSSELFCESNFKLLDFTRWNCSLPNIAAEFRVNVNIRATNVLSNHPVIHAK